MRVSALLPVLGLLLSDPTAAASATSEPREDQIVEASSTSRDQFYDVRGTTADAVFSSIGKKGLGNTPGRAASGLTESKLSYSLESTYGGNKPCRILSLQLRLDIVVTLPRHASPNSLNASARRNWEIYATAVEAHEYRHVEIELRGLEELSTRLRRSVLEGKITAPGKSACANYVDELLSQQRTLTRSRHEEFHRESAREVRDLQAEARGRLEEFDEETLQDRTTLAEFDQLIRAVRIEYENEFAALQQKAYGERVEAEAAAALLVEELNAAITQRNALVESIEQRRVARNTLVEDLLWIR